MSVGHPDYWRRMVSRISIEGYAPEYDYHTVGGQINAGVEDNLLTYPIPASYLFNIVGVIAGCSMPGTVLLSVTKSGGDGIPIYFDTNYSSFYAQGLLATMQYGDTLLVNMVNSLSVDAIFRVMIIALTEFEG